MKSSAPATYAIGDLHGCFKTLMQAIKTIGIRSEDTIVFCGDIVDRGKKVKECLDYTLNRPNTVITMGNHDIAFWESYTDDSKWVKWKFMKSQGMNQTIKQTDGKNVFYAKALRDKCVPTYRYDAPDGTQYIVCHSTYNWQEETEWDSDVHTWSRWFEPEEHPEYFYADYKGPIIVHGHTPVGIGRQYEERVNGKLVGLALDAGCCYGGPEAGLRIMCLTNGKVWEQPNLD